MGDKEDGMDATWFMIGYFTGCLITVGAGIVGYIIAKKANAYNSRTTSS